MCPHDASCGLDSVPYSVAKLLLGIEFLLDHQTAGHSGFMKFLPEWGHTIVIQSPRLQMPNINTENLINYAYI
jgi:hypothetical protein